MRTLKLYELKMSNMDLWPWWIKLLLGFFIFIVVILLGYQLDLRTQLNQLYSLQSKHCKLKQKWQLLQQQLSKQKKYQFQIAADQALMKLMLRQLPMQFNLAEFFQTLTKIGSASGINFEHIRPGKPSKLINEKKISRWPIHLEILGSFSQLTQFIARVSTLERLVTWGNFHLISVNNKFLPKVAFMQQGQTDSIRKTKIYSKVHAESSSEPMQQLSTKVEFEKMSNKEQLRLTITAFIYCACKLPANKQLKLTNPNNP